MAVRQSKSQKRAAREQPASPQHRGRRPEHAPAAQSLAAPRPTTTRVIGFLGTPAQRQATALDGVQRALVADLGPALMTRWDICVEPGYSPVTGDAASAYGRFVVDGAEWLLYPRLDTDERWWQVRGPLGWTWTGAADQLADQLELMVAQMRRHHEQQADRARDRVRAERDEATARAIVERATVAEAAVVWPAGLQVTLYAWRWALGSLLREGWSWEDQPGAGGYVELAPGRRVRVPPGAEVEEVVIADLAGLPAELREPHVIQVDGVVLERDVALDRTTWRLAPGHVSDVPVGERPIAWVRHGIGVEHA